MAGPVFSGVITGFAEGSQHPTGIVPLFIVGHLPSSGEEFPLLVRGGGSDYVNLDIRGGGSDFVKLFVFGNNQLSDNRQLVERGHLPISGGFALSLGVGPTAGISLFLKTTEPGFEASGVPLFITNIGGSNSGLFSTQDLYLECAEGFGNVPRLSATLFLSGTQIFQPSLASIGLFEQSPGVLNASGEFVELLSSNIPLFLSNNYFSSGIPLFTRGINVLGQDMDNVGNITLFIGRKDAAMLNLVLRGPTEYQSGFVNLFTTGTFGTTAAMNLSMSGVFDRLTEARNLYSHGF